VARRDFGRYKIAEEIGRGAMGVVYRALDPMMGRRVAIKAINTSYLEGVGVRAAEYLERFRREAEVAGALSHPQIVKIYDLGPDYLVMEYVEGQSLASLLQGRQRMPPERILQIVAEIAAALDFAHARGIVHRDIKPGNVMVQPDGSAKVMDFGLARIASSTLTAAGEILGSVSYMAPEVILGRPADARSDIFSLGVVAYEMMTGERPFGGGSITVIIQNVVRMSPRPARHLNSHLPPEYDAIFDRALAKEPGARYPTAGAFADELSLRRWFEPERPPVEDAAPLPEPGLASPTVELSARVARLANPSATIPPWPPARVPESLRTPPAPRQEPAPTLVGPEAPTLKDAPHVATAAVAALGRSEVLASDLPPPQHPATATEPVAAGRRPSRLPFGLILGAAAVCILGCFGGLGLYAYRLVARRAPSPAPPPATLGAAPAPDPSAPALPPAEPTPAAAPEPPITAVVEAAPLEPPTPATTAPALATLVVNSDPPGARVVVDRRERGRTPLTLQLRPGKVGVVLSRDGYQPHVADVIVRQRTELNARLVPIPPPTTLPAPTPPPVREGELVSLGPDVAPPRKLSGDSPRTPAAARNLRLSGSVLLEFLVDEEGRVLDPKVVESAGGLLDTACLEAVRTWRYQPATKEGVRVKVVQKAKFTFQLR
jgi:serine/threonine-protein kinase